MRLKPVLAAATGAAAIVATFAAAHAEGRQVAAACIRCTVRCQQCQGGARCEHLCEANGNPMVQANSRCHEWYSSKGCGR